MILDRGKIFQHRSSNFHPVCIYYEANNDGSCSPTIPAYLQGILQSYMNRLIFLPNVDNKIYAKYELFMRSEIYYPQGAGSRKLAHATN
jgi:hypothetical protein